MHIHVCDQWTVTQLHIPFKCVCESERGMCTGWEAKSSQIVKQ